MFLNERTRAVHSMHVLFKRGGNSSNRFSQYIILSSRVLYDTYNVNYDNANSIALANGGLSSTISINYRVGNDT